MQKGFGLIECLITLFLSCLLTLLLVQQYLWCKKQYTEVTKKIEQDIELQLVIELLRDSTRMAGFTPCANIENLIMNPRIKRVVLPDAATKSLLFSRMAENYYDVLGILSPNQLLMGTQSAFQRGNLVIISDCFHAEIQRIKSVKKTPERVNLILSTPLKFSYVPPVYIGQWMQERFYTDKAKDGHKALFYKTQHAEVLTSLITQLSAEWLDRSLLQINLTLSSGELLTLETRMRLP